jgi:DNA-binding beta-propeller fold protein YncE
VSGEAAPYLYVCVQDEARIDIIDIETLDIVNRVDLTALGFSSNASPHHVAVEPDGERWFVSLIGEHRVARFDRENRLEATFEMGSPGMLSLDHSRDLLLVSRSMSAVNPPTRIGMIEPSTMEGDELDVFMPRPHPVIISPDGAWAYTGSLGVNQLASIELDTEDVTLSDVEGPQHALVQFAVSPDGRWLVAGTEISGRLVVFDRSNPSQPRQVASVELGPMVFDPVFAPGGAFVWVPVKGADEVAVVRVDDWSVERRIRGDGLRQPHQIAFSPDGSRAFVSNNNKADHMSGMAGHEGHDTPGAKGNVTVIDTRSYEIVRVLELGRNVTGLGIATTAR